MHSLIHRAGGSIELSSKLGEGTTLCLRLPSSTDEAMDAHDAEPARRNEAALNGAQILVIEDEPLIRANVVYHLRALGCLVFEADTYDAALSQLRELRPSIQLVVSDVMLDRDAVGTRIEAAARQLVPGVRVLFISAHPAYGLMRRGLLDPGARVLEKPFTGDQLKQAVLRSLG